MSVTGAVRRGRRRASGENGSFWLSFSDMMSVLVLIFIFVIFAMLHTLNEHEKQLEVTRAEYEAAKIRFDATQAENEQLVIILGNTENALASAQAELDEAKTQTALLTEKVNSDQTVIINLQNENASLSSQNSSLLSDIAMLNANASELDNKIALLQQEISEKRAQYDSLAAQYNTQISAYKTQLDKAQAQLDQMLGIKAKIIERLSTEFRANGIELDVDKQTGAITLPSSMLFDLGKSELKLMGMNALDRMLPVYLSVLLSSEFRPYVAEIIIEGHTDSTGKYLNNLRLSQERALSVANYILDEDYMRTHLRLTGREAEDFLTLISASGRSYSALIKDDWDNENQEASRRVEIKFSLRDEDTVNSYKQIINNN
ncbi:MAG: OmpA family protein [Clostridia bacterium]|nr:OmpA family protein [Clostridia bacterium]